MFRRLYAPATPCCFPAAPYAIPWRLCDPSKHLAALTTNRNRSAPFPPLRSGISGHRRAAAISGRFSAPPPPRKRSSRPSLSLYLDFPLTSSLTLASDHFPLSHSPLQVRVRAPASATSAAATTAAATATSAEVSVSVGAARARVRANDDGSGGGGDSAVHGGRWFTAAGG